MTDEAPHMLVEEQGAILILTLNRPDKLNALSVQTMQTLEEQLYRFRDTEELKVMLIRATGRYFCAGVDLTGGSPRDYARRGSAVRHSHRKGKLNMHHIFDEMEAIEKPIVVAHHAPCVGGGFELSLSCDFRLAARSAHYSFPEGKMGILPASNGVSRLVRIIGTHWTRYFIMANKKVPAERAMAMGLIHELFEDETFEQDVMAFCEDLARQHGEQMGTAKIAIELAADVGLAQARNVERLANSSLMLDPDFLETRKRHLGTVGTKGIKD